MRLADHGTLRGIPVRTGSRFGMTTLVSGR